MPKSTQQGLSSSSNAKGEKHEEDGENSRGQDNYDFFLKN